MKFGVSNNQLVAGLVAGFVATHVATITGFWYEMINFPIMDWSRWNGTYLVGYGNPSAVGFATDIASDFEVFISGYFLHTFTGLALSLLFVFMLRPMIPLPYDKLNNALAGCIWGGILAVLSFAVIVPLVDAYNNDPGWFSLDLTLPDTNDIQGGIEGATHPGWKTPVAVLIWHMIYGVTLGLMYSPTPEVAPARESAPVGVPSGAVPEPVGGGGGAGGGS